MLNLTPFRCRIARAALHWTYDDLAKRSGFDRMRIHRFEAGMPIRDREEVAAKLGELLEGAGLVFYEDGDEHGINWSGAIKPRNSTGPESEPRRR
jgi:hypothetical protein